MSLLDKIRSWFQKKNPEPAPQPDAAEQPVKRLKKACKNCGKAFSVDPSWEHIPNYCKECRQKFAREKEERQRAGEKRKIKRRCKSCGQFFTFPSTLPHYPNYCSNCRRRHQQEMKEKYSRKKAQAGGQG